MENKKLVRLLEILNDEFDKDEVSEKKQEDEKLQSLNVKISVIIPVYNVEKYLKKCLDSIITQTYKNLEIICVDDGSTDSSLEILHYYEKKDDRIKVLTQKNQGPSAARNKAIDAATGKYISFVDADNFLQWNAYEILAMVAEENELDLIMFGANTFPTSEGEAWIKDKLCTAYKVYNPETAGEVIFHEKASVPFLWLHFLKRDLLNKPGKIRFDESMKLGEDQLFQFLYVPRAKSIMVIEDKLYNYRISRNSSLMQIYNDRKITKAETHLNLIEKIIDAWKMEGYYETEKDNLATWMVNFIYYTLIGFPVNFRKIYAKQFLDIFHSIEIKECLIAEHEQQHLKELKEWQSYTENEKSQLQEMREKIESEKYEITETLNSRAFRLGRALTGKKRRIDLSQFDQIMK